jgi:hypothetical protein
VPLIVKGSNTGVQGTLNLQENVMSIDNFIFLPAGLRNGNREHFRVKSYEELPIAYRTPHQAYLNNNLTDDLFFFEDPEDACWFYREGYQGWLFDNPQSQVVELVLWIDGKEVEPGTR